MTNNYDTDGKVDLSGIYNRSDPVPYFATLGPLDYCIPQHAKPMVRALIDAYRATRNRRDTRVLDIGCSYGVNAALLKYDVTFDELCAHYQSLSDNAREEMLREDALFFSSPFDPELEVIGMDTAHRALRYALDAGLIDRGTTLDLEDEDCDVTPAHRSLLSSVDFVLSTGCFGYVTTRTLDRVLECGDGKRPWMCHSVLRMFDFTDAAEALAEQGYVTEKHHRLIPQRRFADVAERDHVLANLAERGIDPSGREETGWHYAELFVSRPAVEARALPLAQILASHGLDPDTTGLHGQAG